MLLVYLIKTRNALTKGNTLLMFVNRTVRKMLPNVLCYNLYYYTTECIVSRHYYITLSFTYFKARPPKIIRI